MISGLRSFLVHLRLHFQLILSGIFLWAFLLAGGVPSWRALWAFAILHVLLYGGTTAYNAWYDQDEGPVTGLRRPPRAERACLVGGLVFMLVGAALAFTVSSTFALIYIAIMLLSIAYSHPRIRFKNGAATSLGIVAFGQGVLGFAAGAAAAVPRGMPSASRELLLGGAAATLLVTGLYPLTQVFQIDADRVRGDRTFAVRFGPRAVFATTFGCFALALVAVLPAANAVFTRAEVVFLGVALAVLLVVLVLWSRRYDPGAQLANHDRVLWLGLLTSGSFLALIVRHLAARLS
jgi:1,4-dihydroxy-2-naphthoate octaprenyltransferase